MTLKQRSEFKRIIVSSIIAALVPFIFWTGGFNFDERGFAAVYCVLMTLALFGFAYSYPGWEE